jgi:hypothetical protein
MTTITEPLRRNFADWTEQQLRQAFGLKLDPHHAALAEWLRNSQQHVPSAEDQRQLERLRRELDHYARGWNEEELKFFFIGQLVSWVRIAGENFASFAGRRLSAVVGDYELSGIVDALVASGDLEPITPYFCLHEYKSEKGRETDPAGQLLAAMLAARAQNGDGILILGAYVIGRFWFFLSLDGERPVYGVSQSFDASTDDIVRIFGVLKELKRWVARQCGELSE